MRLYLASYRFTTLPRRLVDLVGSGGGRTVVVANAIDAYPPDLRRETVARELDALAGLGPVTELDLREDFGNPHRLRRHLDGVGLVWVRGGNVFVLRAALALSGADQALIQLLRDDALVYGGYSAGPCVLSPTLREFAAVDDPDDVRRAYDVPPRWDGLELLREVFVPHYRSPEHPESAATTALAERLRTSGVPCLAVHDGQALVVDGPHVSLVQADSRSPDHAGRVAT